MTKRLANSAGPMVPAALLVVLASCVDAAPAPNVPDWTALTTENRTYYDMEYSPDGTRITYAATDSGGLGIFVAAADGTAPVRVSPVSAYAFDPGWSPDGQWIVYSSDLFGPPDLVVVPAGGGEPRALTDGPDLDFYPKVSPDGSEVLFRSNRAGNFDIWAVPFDGGVPRPITTSPAADNAPDWSPDGRWVAFWRPEAGRRSVWLHSLEDGTERELTSEGFESFGGMGWSPDSSELLVYSVRTGLSDIWAYPVDGGEPRQITDDIRTDNLASYSPDGRWVLFHSERGGQDDVWIVPSAGGDAIRITDDPAEEAELRWRPDGRAVTFARDDNVSQVFALDVESGTERQITHGETDRGLWDVSPDGQWLLVFSEIGGSDDIHVVPAAGGEARVLVSGPADDGAARWSPDGSHVVFRSTRGGVPHLYVIPAEGGEAVQLTSMASDEPTWSPSGDRIAFTASGSGASDELWVVPADGGEPTRRTEVGQVAQISWHPDGESLMFTAGDPRHIYRIPAEGGTPTRLTPEDAREPSMGVWSPDGTMFAYQALGTTGDQLGFDIFVANADGTGHRRLTEHPAFDQWPFWSADGSLVYFRTRRGSETDEGGDWDLGAVPVEGGDVRILMETPDDELARPWVHVGAEVFFGRVPLNNELVTVEVGDLMDAVGTGR